MSCQTDGINYSLLNGSNFGFYISRARYLNLFVQSITLPSISLGDASAGTPFTSISVPGDQITFDSLNVTFVVDEDLNGYLEMFNWMRGLGFPETYEEYQELVKDEESTSRWHETTSDVQVLTMTGSRNANILYNFVDAFPVNLTAPTLSTQLSGSDTLTCTVTFKYTNFTIKSIKNN